MATETTDTTSRYPARLTSVKRTLAEHRFAYLLLLPTVFFLVVLMWLPFLRGIWMSLHEWPFLGESTWIGLDHYFYLFSWQPFYTSIRATVLYGLGTFAQLGLAIVAALIVVTLKRFKSTVSGILLISYTMPPVITGTLWLYLLNPSVGPIFNFLTAQEFLDQAIYWGSNGGAALGVVTGVMVWTFWPFMFLIILASMENIPDAHYETARIYGASRFQRFRHITFPQIKSSILIVLSIRIIWNLVKVSQPLQLTGGGPGYDTSILAVLLYRFAYNDGSMGIAYAVGMVLLVITMGFAFIFIREFRRSKKVSN